MTSLTSLTKPWEAFSYGFLDASAKRELRRLVGGRFPQIRQLAVRKLAASTSKKAVETLLEVLDGNDEQLRRSAVHALKKSPRAPELLLPRLLGEQDPELEST